jgi:hypothetical protein
MEGFSFNLSKSKAILVGISDYEFLFKIPPAKNNVTDLAHLLCDKKIIGLPRENILSICNKRNDEILSQIIDFLQDEKNIETETLFFYYVGHGVREITSKELFLTGINSKRNTLKSSALAFNDIKQLLENSHIQKRIIVVDACYSGLVTMAEDAQLYTPGEFDIKGSFIMASSSNHEHSFFNSQDRNTIFTAEFINFLRKGEVSLKRPFISLENVFSHLQRNVKQSTPQRKSNLNVSDFYFAINSGFENVAVPEREEKLNRPTPAENRFGKFIKNNAGIIRLFFYPIVAFLILSGGYRIYLEKKRMQLVTQIGISTVAEHAILGNQVWTTRNLSRGIYCNGDPIPEVKSSSEWETCSMAGQGCWCYYNNDSKNGVLYGKLYNWYAINDKRGLAPKGWHISTKEDWELLIKNNKVDSLNIQLGACRYSDGKFERGALSFFASYWTVNTANYFCAYGHFFNRFNDTLLQIANMGDGRSVRLVQD